MNANFYSLWFDQTGNRTCIYRFSSRRSVHETTDRLKKEKWCQGWGRRKKNRLGLDDGDRKIAWRKNVAEIMVLTSSVARRRRLSPPPPPPLYWHAEYGKIFFGLQLDSDTKTVTISGEYLFCGL